MKGTYTVVLGFAVISMFFLDAPAQGTGNDAAVAGTTSQTNAPPNGEQTSKLRVVTTDPLADVQRQRVSTLSTDVSRPGGNTSEGGPANGGASKSIDGNRANRRSRGLAYVDNIIFRMMSRRRAPKTRVRK